jgi:hypothetical protein
MRLADPPWHPVTEEPGLDETLMPAQMLSIPRSLDLSCAHHVEGSGNARPNQKLAQLDITS